MQLNTIELLDWDSNFFGYPVAQIHIDHGWSTKLSNLFQQLDKKKARVTYLFVSPSDRELNIRISKMAGNYIDQKVIYSKLPEYT